MSRWIAYILLLARGACGDASTAETGSPSGSVGGEASLASDSPQHGDLRVSAPVRDAIVTSPLVITGEARGGWYFEA